MLILKVLFLSSSARLRFITKISIITVFQGIKIAYKMTPATKLAVTLPFYLDKQMITKMRRQIMTPTKKPIISRIKI